MSFFSNQNAFLASFHLTRKQIFALLGGLLAIWLTTYVLVRIFMPSQQSPITPNHLVSLQPKYSPHTPVAKTTNNSRTDSWKTFFNSEYKYSFRYPPQFHITEIKNAQQIPDIQNPQKLLPAVIYTYSFTTDTIVNGQPDFSRFSLTIFPTQGRTITDEFSNANTRATLIALPKTSNSDEAVATYNLYNSDRVYRKGTNFFQMKSFLENANLLPDGSDDIADYLPQLYDSFSFVSSAG